MKKGKVNIFRLVRFLWKKPEARELITYTFIALTDFKLTRDEKQGIKRKADALLVALFEEALHQ
jgi:hypothetical protein